MLVEPTQTFLLRRYENFALKTYSPVLSVYMCDCTSTPLNNRRRYSTASSKNVVVRVGSKSYKFMLFLEI